MRRKPNLPAHRKPCRNLPTYPNFNASIADAQEIMSRAAWRMGVRPGDRIGQATLMVIEPGLIHLSRNGEAQRLAMP